MITTKIVFDHRGNAKDNLGPVEIRVTVDRKSYYIGTGVKCFGRDFVNGRIRNVTSGDAETMNERVKIIARRVEEIVNDCIDNQVAIVPADIRKEITRTYIDNENRETAMIDWMDEQIYKLNIKEGTRNHYKAVIKRLKDFKKLSAWSDLTVENIYEFDRYLHGITKNGVPFINDSGVWNYHKSLKALINRAMLFGKIDHNPYMRLHGKFSRGVKDNNLEYLTDDEMDRFCAIDAGNEYMQRAKDLFILQMYTGLSYSDAISFNIDDYKQVDGRWVSVGERIKTGVAYISELLPPVVDVLERNDWRAPQMDNADYNHALKLLGAMAGIKTKLHSHLARHTFATWMLRHGAKIENVSKMLGHTNIEQTQRYAKVLASSVHDEFERMNKILNK